MTAPKLKKGTTLPGGRWTVGEPIAEGKRYRLYEGADAHLDGKRVAIKVPRGDAWATADDARAAIATEGKFLTCPTALIPEPLDAVDAGGWPVLVMELISGEPLAAQIETGRDIGVVRAVAIVRELALFASEVRKREFVFSDFSPSHVLVGLDDVVHVVGTGNARRLDASSEGSDVASLGKLLRALLPKAPPAIAAIASSAAGDNGGADYGTPGDFVQALASLRIEVEAPPATRDVSSGRRLDAAFRPGPRPIDQSKASDQAKAAKPKSPAKRPARVWPWLVAALIGIAGAATAVYFLALRGR